MNNAEVLVKFKGDTKDLDTKTKNSQNVIKGFAKTIGAGLGTAAGIAATALTTTAIAIGNLAKSSVEAYAEFEQLEGGLVSMFGEGSAEMQQIMKDSEEAYHTLTMSQNDYLSSFEKSFPLVNAGLSENANAIEYTNKMLQLSSDLFNTYGGSVEYYQNAINWALKGSFVYLDNLNLGIKGTQEGFIEAANASGILGRQISSVKELTNDEIIDVIQHYAQEYGVWGKTAQEAGDTILGSLNQVKATWNNFIAGLSQNDADINGLVDNLVNSVLTFTNNIVPVIVRAVEGIANALPQIATKIGDMLPDLIDKLLPPLVKAVINLTKSLAQNLPRIILSISDALVDAILGLSEVLPGILDALLQATATLIIALAQALPDMIPTIIDAILGMIPVLIENLPLFIKAGIELLIGLVTGIIQAIPTLLLQTKNIVVSIINAFKNLPSAMWSAGGDMIRGLWNGIKNVTGWITNKIKGFGKSVMNAIKGIFGIHSPSTEFAWIGKMNVLGLEEGMEDMQPQLQRAINGMFDLQPNISGSMSNTFSPQMNVVVNNNMEVDPIGQVVNKIKTFSGGAKNDYNWGAGL
jgi:phage-related protein